MDTESGTDQSRILLRLRQLYVVAQIAIVAAAIQQMFDEGLRDTLILLGGAVMLMGVPFFDRRGRIRAAAILLMSVLTTMVLVLIWLSGGLRDHALLALPGILIFTAMLGIPRFFSTLLIVMLCNVLLLGASEQWGWVVHRTTQYGLASSVVVCIIVLASGFAVWIMGKDYRSALDQLYDEVVKVKRSREEVAFIAQHDLLTGLPNRVLAKDRFEHAVDYITRHPDNKIAVIHLDLDEFKNINDSLGHKSGDRYLMVTAERLLNCVRRYDTVCRIGADEFLIIMENITDEKDVTLVAEKLLKATSQPVDLSGQTCVCSASMGIAIYPNDAHSYEGIVKNADIAMHRSKEVGKNGYHFFDHSMNTEVLERMQTLQDLRQAVEADDQFYLVFQPVVDLNTGTFIGAEALVRWRHPDKGIIPPLDFIPLAEKSGLIVEIGQRVLFDACDAVRQIHDRGFDQFHVAINVSPLQLKRAGFSRSVIDTLNSFELAPESVQLELTESELIDDSVVFQQTMMELREFGVAFAIDDFGTGYSNLGYLRSIDVKFLKIDRSFVGDLGQNLDNEAIVRAVHNMANDLGMDTIAEGVEEQQQLDLLKAIGVDNGQGYFWSKPVELEVLFDLLEQQTGANS